MRGVACAVAVALLGVGFVDATPKPHWTWASLHRPLRVSQIAPGAACQVSANNWVKLGAREAPRPLPGIGPAYPAGLGANVTLDYVYPPDPRQVDFYGSGWGGNKVVWFVDAAYKGPVLIRGRQLDGQHLVRFDRGSPPQQELRIPPSTYPYYRTHPRSRAGYTRLEAPGCYGYQIDGVGFSRVIVFRGRIVTAP